MSTGFDIIFFWVARMIMMGLKFRGRIPFRHVFINGLVRDFKRRKMSKSEGNTIDPLEMIDKYGTDALRFTLAALAVPGMDLALSEERMAGYQAFANKIWNAARFVLMNLKADRPEARESELTLADRWVRSRLAAVTADLTTSLEQYKFYEAADLVYHFVWHEFCDWYVESAKVSLRAGNRTTEAVLADALDRILRLLHPFMPFITEEIWSHLPGAGKSIAVAAFPSPEPGWRDDVLEQEMAVVQEFVDETRKIRTENKIAPRDKIELILAEGQGKGAMNVSGRATIIKNESELVKALAGLAKLEFKEALPEREDLLKGVAGPCEIGIIPPRPMDLGQERDRIQREMAKVEAELVKINRKLENPDFVAKAPAAVVAENRVRLDELTGRLAKLGQNLAGFESPS
jgi:valyl-tRNA synthetase